MTWRLPARQPPAKNAATDPSRKNRIRTPSRSLGKRQLVKRTRAVAELFCRHASFVKHGDKQIVHRRLVPETDMATTLDAGARAAKQDQRQIVVRMHVAVA